jgi:hypothetical protein
VEVATSLDELAQIVRTALSEGDLDTYKDLLAPNAHWGPPDSPQWGCQNRNQIIKWYKTAQDEGMHATVTEVVSGTGALLVGLMVRGRGDEGEAAGIQPRWQVLKVQDGLVTDICGYDDRAEAAHRAGVAAGA